MIGIVGGAGPYAGMELFRKIMEETVAVNDQEHLPVLLYSAPERIPDRTEYLEGKVTENPAFPISDIFLELEKMGATIAAIPCNTAHAPAIFNEIKQELDSAGSHVKVLSIVDETVRFLQKNFPDARSVGVLSTTGTWKEKIYRQVLEKNGYRVLDAENEEEQSLIHQAVYSKEYGIKAFSDPVKQQAKEALEEGAKNLIKKGAELVILGCTEIPIAIKKDTMDDVSMIDTLKVLARAFIEHISPEKLKK